MSPLVEFIIWLFPYCQLILKRMCEFLGHLSLRKKTYFFGKLGYLVLLHRGRLVAVCYFDICLLQSLFKCSLLLHVSDAYFDLRRRVYSLCNRCLVVCLLILLLVRLELFLA